MLTVMGSIATTTSLTPRDSLFARGRFIEHVGRIGERKNARVDTCGPHACSLFP